MKTKSSESRTQSGFVAMAVIYLASVPAAVYAQSYSLDWFSPGGGGASSGGQYAAAATIGETTVEAVNGGPFTAETGFWSVLGSPPAPLLSITLAGGALTVSWPLSALGWVLDETSALPASPLDWTPLAGPYETNTTHIYKQVPNPAGQRFYRLRKP